LLKLCHNERELARVVYNGRMGNRPDTDDGFIFRGAGYLQTTGREDFIKYGKLGGIDFSVDPPPSTDDMSLLLIMSAAEWRSGGCNELCINDNFDGANAVINTGSASKISSVVELGERRKWMRRVTQICAQYENILEPAAAESATRGGAGASLKRAPRTFYQTVTRWLGGGPETPEVILHPELADPSSDQGSRRAAHRFDFDESPAVPAS
jgi:hypothetical protein